MSTRFNPPPFWQQHLPADFRPATDWIPEIAWGAPPADWAMWVNTETGSPASPPHEYLNNPYLFMAVMPGAPAQAAPTAAMPVHAMSGAGGSARFSTPTSSTSTGLPPEGKKPMSKGLKIVLWIVGIIVLLSILGSCVGGNEKTPTPAATPSSTATVAPSSEAPAAAVVAETADASAEAEAEASAKAEASANAEAEVEASAKAEADAKAEAKAEASAKAEAEAEASAKAEADAKTEAEAKANAGTISQRNALRSADSYLEYTAFSRTGLIGQLKFEDYRPRTRLGRWTA